MFSFLCFILINLTSFGCESHGFLPPSVFLSGISSRPSIFSFLSSYSPSLRKNTTDFKSFSFKQAPVKIWAAAETKQFRIRMWQTNFIWCWRCVAERGCAFFPSHKPFLEWKDLSSSTARLSLLFNYSKRTIESNKNNPKKTINLTIDADNIWKWKCACGEGINFGGKFSHFEFWWRVNVISWSCKERIVD